MSDGLNTENRWDGNGSSQSTTVDARMALACTNAKTAGITIYTIHVNTDGDPTSQILKNCASDTSKFFTVTSSARSARCSRPDRHQPVAAAHLEVTAASTQSREAGPVWPASFFRTSDFAAN